MSQRQPSDLEAIRAFLDRIANRAYSAKWANEEAKRLLISLDAFNVSSAQVTAKRVIADEAVTDTEPFNAN